MTRGINNLKEDTVADKNATSVSTIDLKMGPIVAGSLMEMADILASNR